MKLAAIYNVWDGVELLRGSMESVKDGVDLFIIVYQTVSNLGEVFDPIPHMNLADFGKEVILLPFAPSSIPPQENERMKRSIGLEEARRQGCTHFLHMDCDEFYTNFPYLKQEYLNSGAEGSVCSIYTYFRRPTWRFGREEGYFVPFIHQLGPETAVLRCNYAYYVDPTRTINCSNVALMTGFMHHFSWCRLDIERKARNSSAGDLTKNVIIFEDYHNTLLESNPEGFFVRNWNRNITVVPDIFGLENIFNA